jgi:hypothetical protein
VPNRFLPDIKDIVSPPKIVEYYPKGHTPAERDADFERIKIEEKAKADLSIMLAPGEILLTRSNPPSPNKFRNLRAEFAFAKPGIYRVTAVYDDRPLPPPDEEDIQAMMREGYSREHQLKRYEDSVRRSLGLVESNTVLIEAAP